MIVKQNLVSNYFKRNNSTTQTKLHNFTCITYLLHISNFNININNININTPNSLNNIKLNLIYNFLPPNPNISTIQSLKNNNILYLEQLLIANNSYLLL